MGFRSGKGGIAGTGLQFAPPGSVIEAGNTADVGISNALLRADARWSFPRADLVASLMAFDLTGAEDVRAHGAVGDGVHDDTAAIQAAIDGCRAGGKVYLPAPPPGGAYGISAPLVGRKNVTLVGDHAPRWPYDGGTPCVIKALPGFAGAALFTVTGTGAAPNDGGRVFHLGFDGSAVAGGVHGINIVGQCRDWGFFFVSITNCSGSGFRTQSNGGNNVRGLTVLRVTTHQNVSNGFSINDATDCVFFDCLAVSNSAVGYLITNSGDNQFYACRSVFNGSDGYRYTGTHTGSLFVGCSTDRNDKYGFQITATGNYPLIIAGFNFRRDGKNGGAGGGGYACLALVGSAGNLVCPVFAEGIVTSTGVEDDGSGPEAPQYGVSATYASYLFVDGILWGNTAPYNDGGNNTLVRFGEGTIGQTGAHTAPTRSTVPLSLQPLVDVKDANLAVARSSEAGSVQQGVLTPVFYPIDPQGLVSFSLQALAARVRTLEAGKLVGISIYDVAYTGVGTFSATLVASLAAGLSTTTTGTKVGDVTGAPVALDFTQHRYFVGLMVDSTTAIQLSTNTAVTGGSNGALKWTAAARASATDWPANFTQASVAAVVSGDKLPWVGLLTPYGKELL